MTNRPTPSPRSRDGTAAGDAADRRNGPRIFYLDPLQAGPLNGWDARLAGCAGLGFDHVMIAPVFAPGAEGNLFHPADFTRLHAALAWQQDADAGLQHLAAIGARHGVRLLLDVVLDRVAVDSPIAGADAFARPDRPNVVDPRARPHDPGAAEARAGTEAEIETLAAFWSGHLARWHAAGIAGFRLLGLDRLPDRALHRLIRRLREGCAGALLLGWTPGLSWSALPGLVGSGLDHTFSSLPWWDWRSDWLWRELALLARIAPVIGAPEAPYGARLAATCHDPAQLRPLCRRALALAATLGAGWMMPMGFERGAPEPMDRQSVAESSAPLDLGAEVMALNAARAAEPALDGKASPRLLSAPDSQGLALLRTEIEARRAVLVTLNTDPARAFTLAGRVLLPELGGDYGDFGAVPPWAGNLDADTETILAPGEARLFAGSRVRLPERAAKLDRAAADRAARAPRIAIERIAPAIDDGRFPVKRIVGESVVVEADIICDGHDQLGVTLLWRGPDDDDWQERRMRLLGNDRWQARFPLRGLGRHRFTIEAWRDSFATFRDELGKKHAAGVPVTLELDEGVALVREAASRQRSLAPLAETLKDALPDQRRALLLDDDTAWRMAEADDRPFRVRHEPGLTVEAERNTARFASWYEIFPRSMSDDPERHGTFDDVIRHLPRIRDMGFDVLYFPPIHPIGRVNRKGRNNALTAGPDDPGSPYAIGSAEGGHDAIHPALGSFEDFARLHRAAAAQGLEIALDFAIQCAPDHPWLAEHKDWFAWRPDGSLRYAENPPKKYEDIVNVDFYAHGAIPDLWLALCDVVLFWCSHGVRLFRVDNPHTKPLPFWEWLIAEVRARHPDAIFLAEAFTRPKMMYRLAKIGFSQSYTYFTWRHTKRELTEYLEELTTTAPRDFFRPHFFVNTPDINPVFLQTSGRPGFLIRAALAATLSGLWGVYSGFELCEGRPLPGREEYSDSEKYQIRAWDWDRPGNIVADIAALNRIRRDNPALHSHLGLTFLNAWNDAVLWYERATEDRSNVLLVAVSLDPHSPQEADVELPLWRWRLPDHAALAATDLLNGAQFTCYGKRQHLRLTPDAPYAIWRVRPET